MKFRPLKTGDVSVPAQCQLDLTWLQSRETQEKVVVTCMLGIHFRIFYESLHKQVPTSEIAQVCRCIWVNGPVIVGAGPSGLATAARLREQNVPFAVLERADCIASLWQNRTYDRLKLHLPEQFCQLPKMPFPESFPEYPTKCQCIDYLEAYATKFEINPKFNVCVQTARFDETSGLWRVKTKSNNEPTRAEVEYVCRWLVAARGENAETVVPEIEGLSSEFSGEAIYAWDYKSGEKFARKMLSSKSNSGSTSEASVDCSTVCTMIQFQAGEAFGRGKLKRSKHANGDTARVNNLPALLLNKFNSGWSMSFDKAGAQKTVEIFDVLIMVREAFERAGIVLDCFQDTSPKVLLKLEMENLLWAWSLAGFYVGRHLIERFQYKKEHAMASFSDFFTLQSFGPNQD
ncbi:unnamed protein product [Microthlaspi erraticum]|uniref:indole-3-pyruvate monooxygenase n=1 Tax=Microthlaspi erraticum TaxID=1685480 RepID=A0A6D2HI37_9BRAS|nr:unnamed protein product [Microthlaspi erraticum]